MPFDFVVYVSGMSEEQADGIAGRWPETTSGARAGREYVGFTREAGSLDETIDRATTDLKSLEISPLKVEAELSSGNGGRLKHGCGATDDPK